MLKHRRPGRDGGAWLDDDGRGRHGDGRAARPEAISAAGVGNAMHIAFAIFGMAVMLGLDTLVSQAYGARDIRECHRWFFDGLTLAGLMAVPIMALLVLVWFAIPLLGFHERGAAAARVVLRRRCC